MQYISLFYFLVFNFSLPKLFTFYFLHRLQYMTVVTATPVYLSAGGGGSTILKSSS